MILPLLLVLFLAAFTHADDVSPACHDKKIHEFPIALKELHAQWYLIGSSYELESIYDLDKIYPYWVLDISAIEGKTTLTYWNGAIGNLEVVVSENATFVEHDDHVILHEPLYSFSSPIHKVSDDCIKLTFYNFTDTSHAQGDGLFCRSHRGNDADAEAFKQRSRCRNFNYILMRQNYFEYASKCHSVAHHLDPLEVKSILGLWYLVARAGKDDKIMDPPDDQWSEVYMNGESLKIQKGSGSVKTIVKEATVSGSKILVKHENTSFVITFYPTCKDCLLLRHEAVSDGNVKLALFRKSGKLTPEEVEKFKENARCFSLPVVNVLQDNHKAEQKEDAEIPHSKESSGKDHPN